jgi:3-hydroxyisobutyrate dehydrogenase-like beta-hydroxyacid dehydrogenase
MCRTDDGTTMTATSTPITFLGLGAMGRVLASAALEAGHPITVWNRSPGRADALAERGAAVAATVVDAASAAPVVVACLFDHASVHETLDPVVANLSGRTLINLTTTTPNEARELAAWAAGHGIDYLDGAIMAVPEMIGGPGSAIFTSGSQAANAAHAGLIGRWGDVTYFGEDAGVASLYDMAMLSGMYLMFAGFFHGAAMVASAGFRAEEFAARQTTFLAAMTGSFAEFGRIVDAKDYAGEGQQSLEFSDLTKLVRAAADAGVSTELIESVQQLIRRQIDAGHGKLGVARIFEELRGAA